MVGLGFLYMKASECYAKTSGLEHGTHRLFSQGNGMLDTKGTEGSDWELGAV